MSHVVVIGGGFAGLAAATALAARGRRVTILEAGSEIGGRARCVEAAGARVDLGPTILTDLSPLRELFEIGGRPLDEGVALERLEPGFIATFPSGARLAVHADPSLMGIELRSLGPEAPADWDRLLHLGAKARRLMRHFIARGDVASPRDLARFLLGGGLSVSDLVPFARWRSLDGLLGACIRTPELRTLLAHCARFVGLDAHRAPSATLVIPYLLATSGIWYPRGGVSALADAVLALAVKHGAALETGARVERLVRHGDRLVAALTADGRRVDGDLFVAAVDARATARWLSRDGRGRQRAPAHAARVAWWVVEGLPPRRAHHAFHFDQGGEPVYVATPTLTDSTLAPAGASVVYALLHGPAGSDATPAFAASLRQRVERAGHWPAGRVLARGVDGGGESCYGDVIRPGLFGSFRPSQRVAGVHNLVRAGGSVFPGPGVANVVRSGLRAAALLADPGGGA